MQYNSDFIDSLKKELSDIDTPITPLIYLLCEEAETNKSDEDDESIGWIGTLIQLTGERNMNLNTSQEIFYITSPSIYESFTTLDVNSSVYLCNTLEEAAEIATYIVEHYTEIYL